jgi:hypothetical protein
MLYASAGKNSFTVRQRPLSIRVGSRDRSFATLRAQLRGEGHDRTRHQAHALAREWCRWYIRFHEENPASPNIGRNSEFLVDRIADVAGEWVQDRDGYHCELDFKAPSVRQEIHPIIADEAKATQFLASNLPTLRAPSARCCQHACAGPAAPRYARLAQM